MNRRGRNRRSVGVPLSFSPFNVGAGPVLWLNADVGVTTGATLTWVDQSGSGNNFTQSNAANQPTLVTSAYNGHSTLRGNDATDNIAHATNVSLGTQATIFIVMKQGSDATNWVMENAAESGGILSRFTGGLIEWYNGGGTDRFTLADTPSGLHIYTIRQTNGSALQGWNNGTSAFGPTVPAATLTDIKNFFARTIGANGSAAQDIPEVLVYRTALANSDRLAVERMLGAKYAITVA